MLASITPLGERGRRQRWGITVTAFLAGALGAGAGLGAVLGAIAAPLTAGMGTSERLAALGAAAALGLAVEIRGAVPGPRRQVDRRWLDMFRGWVYGAGFGAQLGLGVLTRVTSAATYVALVAAALSGGAARGSLIVGTYGAARGLQPLAAARVTHPAGLVALHRRLERTASAVTPASATVLAAIVIGAVAGALA